MRGLRGLQCLQWKVCAVCEGEGKVAFLFARVASVVERLFCRKREEFFFRLTNKNSSVLMFSDITKAQLAFVFQSMAV